MNRILELLQGPDPDDAAFTAWWDATFTGAPCHGDMTAHAVAYAAWLGRGGGWQPIETAPKDNRDVLLWCPHPDDNDPEVCVNVGFRPTPDCSSWDNSTTGWVRPKPTHWMPLPEPPK